MRLPLAAPRLVPPSSRPARCLASVLIAALAVTALPSLALAHAKVVSSTPADGASLTERPTTVSITFDEALGSSSHFEVVDASGATVGSGKLAAGDAKTLTGTVAGGGPGAFEVKWTAASSDGDIARGVISFTVAAVASAAPTSEVPSAPATTTPTSATPRSSVAPSAAASPGASASGGAASSTDSGVGVLLPIVIVLVLAAGGFALLRGRSTAR